MNAHIIKKAIRIIFMSRWTPVRVATGRDQKATMGCEESDGAVRSGSEIATVCSSHSEHDGCAVAMRLRTRPIRPSRSQGLRLNSTEKGQCFGLRTRLSLLRHRVVADERGKKMSFLWLIHSSPATKSSSTRPQQNSSLFCTEELGGSVWPFKELDGKIAGRTLEILVSRH
ncbi:hypothetical protein Taro_053230 [Colocasia esculenta]|uniref:Uncharacterized protein n=1 Tax=Colocasia esculenta TaxID=4460 RepID=A0A843XKM0_COLES|nr:hypothetical protein [Colocasia esculenta]